MTVLDINDLEVRYHTDDGDVHAVRGVDLHIEENETLGLVGESGCGKSTFAKSLIRLLAVNGEIESGSVDLQGTEVTDLSKKQLNRQVRWTEISMIPQNAMNGFDPVYTVGDQIVEVIQQHEDGTSKKEAKERARDLFEKLGIEGDRVEDYPHQFSGGMAQRAMVALALSLSPSVVLADEPTTALDVVIQDRILGVIQDLQDELGSAMLLITHDMSVVSEQCDRIAVMYGGRVIEEGPAETIIKEPNHPYTLGLRNSFPDITAEDQDLISIPGAPPELIEPEEGCAFAPRCPFAEEECWEETPAHEEMDDGHYVECHRADEMADLREEAGKRETWTPENALAEESETDTAVTDGGHTDD
jgi:peptide/nickel transport system ATP-binding protein